MFAYPNSTLSDKILFLNISFQGEGVGTKCLKGSEGAKVIKKQAGGTAPTETWCQPEDTLPLQASTVAAFSSQPSNQWPTGGLGDCSIQLSPLPISDAPSSEYHISLCHCLPICVAVIFRLPQVTTSPSSRKILVLVHGSLLFSKFTPGVALTDFNIHILIHPVHCLLVDSSPSMVSFILSNPGLQDSLVRPPPRLRHLFPRLF